MTHTADRTIVYVSCAETKQIVVLAMDKRTGSLRETSRAAVPGTAEPSSGSLPLALSADRRFLYAGLRTAPYPVASFAIDPRTGALRCLGTAELADSMCYLSLDPSGRFLFSASYGGARLAVNAVSADGQVGKVTQVLATPPNAHSALPDPSGRFVYTACLGGDVVICQAFDAATGLLAPAIHPAASTKKGAGPRHLAFGAGILYVVNELDGSINVYERNDITGALRERQSISLLPTGVTGKVSAADIHLTPDGRHLYASERTTHTLTGFTVSPADGTLTPLCRVPSEATPRGFAIDPSGRFLLCAGLTSGGLGVYAIEPDSGMLVRTGAIPVGMGANWVEIFDLPE